MTNGDYGDWADQLEKFMRELEPWRESLTAMSEDPLPDRYHALADEHGGAIAKLLEELREHDGRHYRLTDRGGIPSSLSGEARAVLEALRAADLPGHFTYEQVKDLGTVRRPGTRYEALRGQCWPEFRELLGAGQVV